MSARRQNRAGDRPAPEDWDDGDPMTLQEIVAVFSARYPCTVSTLRLEIGRERLTASFVGGAYYVTPANLKALFACPVPRKARASTFAKADVAPTEPSSPTSGAYVTDRSRSAQAAALIAVKALAARKSSSHATSSRRRPPPSTCPPTAKSSDGAGVIPMRFS